jgi:Homeodomain-like domain
MLKKYIVNLSAKERRILREVVKTLNGSSQKVRRAQMLLKADVAGPAWTDEQIADAFDSRTRTVEKLRERFVTAGFEQTLHGKTRENPPVEKILSGKQEAQLIALRLSPPPKGYANWSLRLLARKVVELQLVETISHETVRRTLKKMA